MFFHMAILAFLSTVVRLLIWQVALWGVEPEPFRDLKALGQKPKIPLLLHSIGQHGSQARIQ